MRRYGCHPSLVAADYLATPDACKCPSAADLVEANLAKARSYGHRHGGAGTDGEEALKRNAKKAKKGRESFSNNRAYSVNCLWPDRAPHPLQCRVNATRGKQRALGRPLSVSIGREYTPPIDKFLSYLIAWGQQTVPEKPWHRSLAVWFGMDAFRWSESMDDETSDLLAQLTRFAGSVFDWGYNGGLYLDDREIEIFCDSHPSSSEWSNPIFATTGAAAFGFVPIEGPDIGPAVVMFTPQEESPNHETFVVGASLREFLCLGCVHGFHLDELAFTGASAIADLYSQPAEDHGPMDVFLFFREALNLEPWNDISARLNELQKLRLAL